MLATRGGRRDKIFGWGRGMSEISELSHAEQREMISLEAPYFFVCESLAEHSAVDT